MRALVRAVMYRLLHHSIESVSGLENVPARGPYLLALNHVDYLDGYYLLAALYRQRPDTIHYFTLTNNYWWAGFVHPVRWDDKTATVREAANLLRSGAVVCNFPEGKRNDTDRLLPGKTGTVRMALEARVPIIPVGIRTPSGRSFAQSWRLSRQARGRTIFFGPRLDLSDYYGTPIDEALLTRLTAKLMAGIAHASGKHLPQIQ